MPEGDEPAASTRRDVENLTFLCASRRFPTLANPWLSHGNRRARTASLAAEQIGVALVNVPTARRTPAPQPKALVSPASALPARGFPCQPAVAQPDA